MPHFLTTEEIYRVLQRELPPNVYPDGPANRYDSTAENWAVADAVSGVYSSLQKVYNNFFPQSANEQLRDWEIRVFGFPLQAGLSVPERRSRVIAQIRQDISISLWDMLLIINGYVPDGVYTQILTWGGQNANEAWIIGQSRLGLDTILGPGPGGEFTGKYSGENGCDIANADYLNPSTQAQVIAARKAAYFYEVRIYDYTLSADDLTNLTNDLNTLHPVRSDFVIYQNVSLSGSPYQVPVTDVDRFSNVQMIARNAGSSTGYIGRTRGP